MKIAADEKIFNFINTILLTIFIIMIIYPLIYIFSASVSDPIAVESGSVILFPKDMRWNSYIEAFNIRGFWMAYANTFFYTIGGVMINMLFTATGAYVLSKKRLKYRRFLTLMLVVTMWFDPGIIPKYLNFRDLGLIDTRVAPIIGFAVNTFNLIILKTFFESIPESLEEAAKIDGASDFMIFTKVFLPLSKTGLITVSLFYAVSRWNGYFWMMVLLNSEDKIPLQVLLRTLIIQRDSIGEETATMIGNAMTSPQTVIYAVIVLSMAPMLVAYPFIQKYFKKGVTVGAVKE